MPVVEFVSRILDYEYKLRAAEKTARRVYVIAS